MSNTEWQNVCDIINISLTLNFKPVLKRLRYVKEKMHVKYTLEGMDRYAGQLLDHENIRKIEDLIKSQKSQKFQECGIFTLYSLGFLDNLHFCCFDENYYVF